MGTPLPSPAEHVRLNSNGLPQQVLPRTTKTKYDFPRAKSGRPDRFEFPVGVRHPGKPRRLDKYLLERFPGYSRSFLQKLIKDGRVLVNGHTVKSSWHATTGEQITVLLPPGTIYEAEEIPFDVLYEDAWMLAVNKPSGIIVHPARGHKTGTMYHGLMFYYRERMAADPSFRIRTVHRLDEETSGVIVFPLDYPSNAELTRQFENRRVRKTYLCLVHGTVVFESREIDAPLGVDPECKVRGAVGGLDAREASTRFEFLAHSTCREFSLLRAHPHTGRSHQIRIHAMALGHPLAGDELYGGKREHPAFGAFQPRVCLHAESLTITHPTQGHPLTLRAPLAADIKALAERLGLNSKTWTDPS